MASTGCGIACAGLYGLDHLSHGVILCCVHFVTRPTLWALGVNALGSGFDQIRTRFLHVSPSDALRTSPAQ